MTEDTPEFKAAMNLRQKAKARTAQKVLDAAKSMFETDGYEATTMRLIAKRAGMSTGAIFANYKDKAVLYGAVYGHPPVSPEQGAALMRSVEAFLTWHTFREGEEGLHDAELYQEAEKLKSSVTAIRPVRANFEA